VVGLISWSDVEAELRNIEGERRVIVIGLVI